MPDRHHRSGWRGVALVAVTYVYFLIFAQFAFLSRLAELNLAGTSLKILLAAMAAGGILFSLLTPRVKIASSPSHRLRLAFATCAVAAWLSMLPLGILAATALAFLIGAGLGVLTVTLVTHLRAFAGDRNPILNVGLGTGIGYFICNVPPLFTAAPQTQAIIAAALCLIAIALASEPSDSPATFVPRASSQFSLLRALTTFAALVWLDSAAFFIIQHSAALKAGTWLGSTHLWTNACLHLASAVAAAWLLQHLRSGIVLPAAFVALGFACLLLRNPALTLPASLFYPIGVSLYSVTLVAFPSFLTSATSTRERGIQAGWIYAVAGWMGSALGIGMGQNLGHVPAVFVAVAGTVVLIPAFLQLSQSRTREIVALSITFAVASVIYVLLPTRSDPSSLSEVDRGRSVYISEGCIHCHSQFVRPNSQDVLMWGPVQDLQQVRAQQPPLIGNRRQGPDLTQVGTRRSPLWLKAHLIDPPEVSGGSIMPSFAFLFGDQRGDDLVAYLASLHGGDTEQQFVREQEWQPSASAIGRASAAEGRLLYQQQCATCHDSNGRARLQYQSQFRQSAANLATGSFQYLRSTASNVDHSAELSRISKFGIHSTDMPGHEYLSDQQIASLTLFLMNQFSNSVHHP